MSEEGAGTSDTHYCVCAPVVAVGGQLGLMEVRAVLPRVVSLWWCSTTSVFVPHKPKQGIMDGLPGGGGSDMSDLVRHARP